jgi:hypothetical protein
VSRRVALGYRNRTDLANSLQPPCARRRHRAGRAGPAPAPTRCWKQAAGRRAASSSRAGNPPTPWSNCAAPPLSRSPTPRPIPLPRLHRGLLLELRRRIIAPAKDATPETMGRPDPHGDWPEQGT